MNEITKTEQLSVEHCNIIMGNQGKIIDTIMQKEEEILTIEKRIMKLRD
jgi:hypothetical protein